MYDLSIVDNTIYGGILMDNNINVLDELNKGCSMGIEAIELILKKVNNNEFHDLLVEFNDCYIDLSDEIKELYQKYSDDDVHEVNAMEKLMTWYGIEKDTILDDSTSKLADMLINGTTMGIIEGRKILNNKKMSKDVHKMCEKYVDVQEKYVEKLKKYL